MTASSATTLYHVNPKIGAQPCGVTVGVCPFGEDSPHFGTEKEAADEFTRQMEEKHDPLAPAKRDIEKSENSSKNAKARLFDLPKNLAHVEKELSELSYEEIYDYVAGSHHNHNNVKSLVVARNEISDKISKVLENVNPLNVSASAVSGGTYLRMIEESRRYKRETDTFSRACDAVSWKWKKSSVA